jgi:hypothetical protein
MASITPIFVVGVPRSGTTLLASILSAHPAIHAGPETHFFEEFDRRRPPAPSWTKEWVSDAVQWLMQIQHVGGAVPLNAGLTPNDLCDHLSSVPLSYRALLESLVVPQMRRAGKTRWLEKTPNHIAHLPTLRHLFPESHVVRIVRDPRDTIHSLLNVPWGPSSLPAAVSMFADNYFPGERFCESDSNTITIRYEDLVTCTSSVLKSIGEFVKESFDPDSDRSKSSAEVNRTIEPWKAKVSERIDPTRAGSWAQTMPESDQRFIEALLGEPIDRHLYPRRFFPRGTHLQVMPIRGLEDCPSLVQTIADGTLGESSLSTIVLAGKPDPQRILDRPTGSRLAMLAELTTRLAGWTMSGRRVIWWDESRSPYRGRMTRCMQTLLKPYRVTRVAC